ncbi:MAG: glutamine-hydrolyzing carbamoyl-phosphate synthase small subunit [Clostridia bacterium]|nr:glutamine-hydrolyzing carbamoyl-phosphate synthase small subunit [Clostridia bacterium]
MQSFNRKIILENGEEYPGYSFGATDEKVVEIVFNTSMVGYQEIISDPSYTDQGVVMTYPLIGNYGMAYDDYESQTPSVSALIVKEYNDRPSNFRSEKMLSEVMKKYGISGIYGVDTRKLTRSIRDFGSRRALITDICVGKEQALGILSGSEAPRDAVARVSCKKSWSSNVSDPVYRVVAVDCGMKLNIVRSLNKRGCDVTVVPHDISSEEIEALKPNGIFFSNGPGDPVDNECVIELVKKLRGKYPIFGICLGHQIISLAYGAKTYKLKFGHRGGNHPVKNLETGKIEITSQNHSYAVDKESIKNTRLKITHINILDNTVEGVECKEDKIFSVQYHPESAPGPEDSTYLFDKFTELMREEKENA